MGKKRYNAKARQVVNTNIDNSRTQEIKLEFAASEYGTKDPSNLLALPSKKRNTKIVLEKTERTRFLSKAQRKRLEKIVEKKKKKANRSTLLESLSQVQASSDEVKHLTTISSMQTLGLRKLTEINSEVATFNAKPKESDVPEQKKFSSIAGAKKRLRLLRLENADKVKRKKYDPNIVGLEETDNSESSETEEENDVVKGGETIDVGKGEETIDVSKGEETIDVSKGEETNAEKVPTTVDITETEIVDSIPIADAPVPSVESKKAPTVECKKNVTIKPLDHPSVHIDVKRDPKIQVARLKLPILGEEQRIMELINENEFVIIAGETGSGKTTQLPQFLYEAGYAEHKMIAVTEPRRVATVAMSSRVAYELGLTSKEVSYLMRFEGNVTKDTKIKFMTDGVLLKEIQNDFLMSKYSVVIIDEAHERSVYTDILLGLLSRIVPLRRKRGVPLRLIVMSATLRVEDFTENTRLFKVPPPLIKIEARQFPVTIHFNKHTYSDYLKEAYKKAVKIHTRLPEGGILIFVTGQQELITKRSVCDDKQADALDSEPEDIESDDDEVEKEMKRSRKARKKAKQKARALPKINLDDYDMPADDGQADLVASDDDSEHLSDSEIKSCRQPLWALPLYSMLSSSKQGRVFAPPPPGARLCVVSTDVAETSLTIPAIKYVVDTGKKKMKVYDHQTGASAWRVVWSSQASAEQRAGRAGRTGAGHAYRVYSAAVFQHRCVPHHEPDLRRRPVDDLLLQMKCMAIDKVPLPPYIHDLLCPYSTTIVSHFRN
ncbi:unnamed protein product [Leptidea sinapis]|uniref:RNA helicase n=1 Tax=Leptidea sinapis TaxID=189913 RepID=A0A5E4QCY1_9NEOP|nr:unnamed protein product [Leptidea sinapis]